MKLKLTGFAESFKIGADQSDGYLISNPYLVLVKTFQFAVSSAGGVGVGVGVGLVAGDGVGVGVTLACWDELHPAA
ncbi:MAG TPA: hypothetical protein VE973_01365, partial [Candidatus Limnocylindria bacterium]|nr:hypothetical protein [Candidatus Limnocylindria bacterium]